MLCSKYVWEQSLFLIRHSLYEAHDFEIIYKRDFYSRRAQYLATLIE